MDLSVSSSSIFDLYTSPADCPRVLPPHPFTHPHDFIWKLNPGYTENLASGFEGTESNPGTIALGFYSGMFAYDGWQVNLLTVEKVTVIQKLGKY